MSQENVEIAKRTVDAYNRRDLDRYHELFTPDLEWVAALPHAQAESRASARNG